MTLSGFPCLYAARNGSYQSDLLLEPSARFGAIFTFFSAISPVCAPRPPTLLAFSRILNVEDRVIPRSVCDVGMGCPSLVHLAPPAVI